MLTLPCGEGGGGGGSYIHARTSSSYRGTIQDQFVSFLVYFRVYFRFFHQGGSVYRYICVYCVVYYTAR